MCVSIYTEPVESINFILGIILTVLTTTNFFKSYFPKQIGKHCSKVRYSVRFGEKNQLMSVLRNTFLHCKDLLAGSPLNQGRPGYSSGLPGSLLCIRDCSVSSLRQHS